MSNVRLMYLRNSEWFPVACVAVRVDRDDHIIDYQISTYNPVDKFDKATMRSTAIDRLDTNPISIVTIASSLINGYSITKQVMEDIALNNKMPARSRKAAKRWLNHHRGNSPLSLDDSFYA